MPKKEEFGSGSMTKRIATRRMGGVESTKQRYLLFHSSRARVEVDAERLVLDVVPPDADTEADAAGSEQRERGDLFGHQCALALGQYEDVGHELE